MLLGGIPYNLGSTLSGARMCILIGSLRSRSRSGAGGLTGVSKSKGVICLPSRASTNQRERGGCIYKRACFVPTPPSVRPRPPLLIRPKVVRPGKLRQRWQPAPSSLSLILSPKKEKSEERRKLGYRRQIASFRFSSSSMPRPHSFHRS